MEKTTAQRQKIQTGLAWGLFVFYMLLLVWIILFKLGISIREIRELSGSRSLNLIPFYYANERNFSFHVSEVVQNVLIFIPFGIYISMLRPSVAPGRKILIAAGVSLFLETAQYIFAIGCSDITDLLTNTGGAVTGMVFYVVFVKIFHSRQRADWIMTILALIVTIAFTALVSIILVANQ